MTVTPDIAGLRDAQKRLRQQLGVDATFLIGQAKTYAPGTYLDPESQRPLDPFQSPTSDDGPTEVVKRVSFASRPFGRGMIADRDWAPIGNVDTSTAALIVDPDDYDDVKDARRVRVLDNVWQIQSWRHDSVGPVDRWLCLLEDA